MRKTDKRDKLLRRKNETLGDFSTTPLRLTVKAGKNTETFDLGEAVQEEEEIPAAGF